MRQTRAMKCNDELMAQLLARRWAAASLKLNRIFDVVPPAGKSAPDIYTWPQFDKLANWITRGKEVVFAMDMDWRRQG